MRTKSLSDLQSLLSEEDKKKLAQDAKIKNEKDEKFLKIAQHLIVDVSKPTANL